MSMIIDIQWFIYLLVTHFHSRTSRIMPNFKYTLATKGGDFKSYTSILQFDRWIMNKYCVAQSTNGMTAFLCLG